MERLQSNLKNMALSLTLIALIAAGILGVVYALTKEPIAIAEQNKQNEAINLVLPENDRIEQIKAEVEINGQNDSLKVYRAFKGDQLVGYAVETMDPKGFNGEIRFMVGFDAEGNIKDYSILKQGETPGLGAKMNDWFKAGKKGQIAGLNPGKNNMIVKKDKNDKGQGEVDGITAATISSRAFLRAVDAAYRAAFSSSDNAIAADAATGATKTDGACDEAGEKTPAAD